MSKKKEEKIIELFDGDMSNGSYVNISYDVKARFISLVYNNIALTFHDNEYAELGLIIAETCRAAFGTKNEKERDKIIKELAEQIERLRMKKKQPSECFDCREKLLKNSKKGIEFEKGLAA